MAYKRRKRSEERWAETGPEVIRCTAHLKSDGTQCRWEAAPGTNVCNQHGALAPQVQARAATRIQMSVDDAVKRLQSMLDDEAVDARDKIKILHDLLDRGGLGATSKVLVGVGSVDPVEKLFSDLLSDPRMFQQPQALPAERDPELLALNAKVLEEDDELDPDDVLIGQVVEEAPRPAPAPVREKAQKTPPHIRKVLEGLL